MCLKTTRAITGVLYLILMYAQSTHFIFSKCVVCSFKKYACVVKKNCSFNITGPRGPSAVVAIAHLNQVTHFCV